MEALMDEMTLVVGDARTAGGTVQDEMVNTENMKAAQEADLIEAGRYKFQVLDAPAMVSDKEYFDDAQTNRNPFYGKTVYNLKLALTAKRAGKDRSAPWETLERGRTIYQRVLNATVLDRRGEVSTESKLFGQMAGIASASLGRALRVSEVLDFFKDNAGEVTITKSEERTDDTGRTYAAKNWTRGIKQYVG